MPALELMMFGDDDLAALEAQMPQPIVNPMQGQDAEPASAAYETLTRDATDQQIVDRAAVIDLDHGDEAAIFIAPSSIVAVARELAAAAVKAERDAAAAQVAAVQYMEAD